MHAEKENFYFAASRLVPYKRIDMIAEAFTKMSDKKLKIVGDGPQMEKLKAIVGDAPNIEIMGYQSNEVMVSCMQKAKALVFAAEEDFGIIPVEAQACGTPVIAYGKGGCLETVVDGITGIHFEEQNVESLINAVNKFESLQESFDAETVRENANRFSISSFKNNLEKVVLSSMEK